MLSPELQAQIQTYFKECVKARNLSLRHGQRVMIAEVAKCFATSIHADLQDKPKGNICVVEAGTGTGKTLAYTLGALPVAMEYEKALVISTATVALQEQLISKDLPELRQHSSLDFQFALVKGRARYVCLSKLLLWEKHDSGTTNLFLEDMLLEDVTTATAEDITLYRAMIQALDDNQWDGERDHWPIEIKHKSWSVVMANRQDCNGKKCPHYSQCSFFEARKTIAEADVIVTNHDLVMADLLQGESSILPPVEDAFYIFDEAHHLPDKALSHHAANFRVRSSQTWLLRSQSMLDKLVNEDALACLPQGDVHRVQDAVIHTQEQIDELYQMVQAIYDEHLASQQGNARNRMNVAYLDDSRYIRFEHGIIPEHLREKALYMQQCFTKLAVNSAQLLETLKTQLEGEDSELARVYLSGVANVLERAEASAHLFATYAKKDTHGQIGKMPLAKWIRLQEFGDMQDFMLSASPVHASEVLHSLLWERCLGVLLTSATLTALGSFDYFIERSGLPERATYFRIASPFNYHSAATLVLPEFASEPNDGNAYILEVARFIEKWQPLSMGSLVLFSSWAQMNEVSDFIDARFHKSILKQGESSKEEIMRLHREAIDQHRHSMIFGLASFAEGIDLPGDYLSHVIICKIPFSVPTDPMAEALSEWVSHQGKNPFTTVSVPEASLKLIQACGRLLRSESDSGRISILDKRLRTKFYGKQLLSALPPYKVQIGDN